MEDIKALRRFLLGRFFVTLVLVGIAQLLVNIGMRTLVMPHVESFMGIDGILDNGSLTETLGVFTSCLITLLLRKSIGGDIIERLTRSKWAPRVFGSTMMDKIRAIDEGISNTSIRVYSFLVVLMLLVILILWVMPFVVGAIAYSRRVSHKINELEKERIAREKEYEKQRNLLLSDITHDIKTPITTIAGFSRALADGAVPPQQQQEYQEAVYNKSMKVSELVSLLFEYIKLDSNGYVLNRAQVDFAELVRGCVAGVYTEMEEKKLEVEIDITDDVLNVNADRMQLERAINNLMTNTVKYCEAGTTVQIEAFCDKSDAVFRVSDNGIRIEKEDAVHLFEPFVRADKARQSGSGSGLGLSIAKKIVDMHGGRIMLIQYQNPDKYKMVKTFEIRLPM